MRKKTLSLSLLILLGCICIPQSVLAQRIQQPLGRGVAAVKNGTSVFISWRKLAQEPEEIQYNIYKRPVGSESYTKINSAPLSVTNFSTTTTQVNTNYEVAVSTIVNGVEQPISEPFVFKSQPFRSVFVNITYSTFLPHNDYTTKFIWPADLTGDGEYDYVVDRLSINGLTHKIEGYTRFGEHLWTVDLGPNVPICGGHDDMVLAYDMNCNGRAEVVIKSSDGTRFWDKENNTWGKYLLGSENGDTDNDGIIDYNKQGVRNPPQYITVIDGLTGAEISTIEMPFPSDGSDTYSRDNKASYMGRDNYNQLNGHMGICYLDGVHPSVSMEYMVRTENGTHHYYVSAWGYDFKNGEATEWKEHFTWSRNDKRPWPAEFHHIRIADVDLDGRDEILDGGFAVKHDGTMLFSAGISHGDRFRVGDIDPTRPGLETFAIQQNAGDMLGQILYDAGTGEPIKKWYLAGVGDVGRGECMDVDPAHKGYEMWSTMGNLYNSKGELIKEGSVPFPTEGVWWDGELDREHLSAPDGNGYNAYVGKFNGPRLIEMASISGWTVAAEYGTRPAFFGDMIGDWREEVILRKKSGNGCSGIMGFTTDYATPVSLYCLQENPAYRMQCTTRGYYQSPIPDFYLGYDMPYPPLPPCMVTDIVWNKGNQWGNSSFISFDRSGQKDFTNGTSVLFDVSGDDSSPIAINEAIRPSVVYVMAPKGKNYIWTGTGSLEGEMDLWKSMNGTLTVNLPLNNTGKTIISEGTLILNNTLKGTLDLRAKGTLAGNAVIDGGHLFEGALNYEGCRLSPGTEQAPYGTITFNKGLNLTGDVYLEMNLTTAGEVKSDLIQVNGDLNLSGTQIINLKLVEEKAQPGEYTLIKWTGEHTGDSKNFKVEGLKGHSYELQIKDQQLVLVIKDQRAASKGVKWTGSVSGIWDFETENFSLNNENTTFVAGDEVTFSDEANTTVLQTNDWFETTGVYFNNETTSYTLNGSGGFSGTGGITKTGNGRLTINSIKNDYTGATVIKGGTVTVAGLADANQPSSIGAAANDAANLQIEKATFAVNNASTATDRGLTITDTVTINIQRGNTSLKGIIKGAGTLVKTGSGQLNVTYAGTNTYSKGTIVKAGILAQGSYNSTFGTLGSPLTIEGGTVQIFNNDNTSQVPNFNYKVTVPKGANVTLSTGSRCHINGSFSGEGTINLTVPYVRTDIMADWSNFNGKLIVSGRDFRLCRATNMKGTALTLNDGIYMGHFQQGSGNAQSYTSQIGSLASSTTTPQIVNGSYQVGYNNTNTTYAGKLGGVTVSKYGTGIWTLTGTGNTSATLNIYGGTVLANNTSGLAASSVTIQNGGTLSGNGTVNSVSLKKGSVLKAGKADYLVGKLSIKNTLTAEAGATISLKINRTGNDVISVGGNASFGKDTLLISVTNRTLAVGDEFKLIECNGRLTGNFIIEPAIPGEGLAWDDSELLSDGILRVTSTNGIHAIGNERVKIYPQIVTDQCHVDASQACEGEITMQITNSNGMLIKESTFDASATQTIQLGGHPEGVYFIRLTHNNQSKVMRIVKVSNGR